MYKKLDRDNDHHLHSSAISFDIMTQIIKGKTTAEMFIKTSHFTSVLETIDNIFSVAAYPTTDKTIVKNPIAISCHLTPNRNAGSQILHVPIIT